MGSKWTDTDEKILLYLALEHGHNNYKAIAAAWPGQGGHSLRGITDRLRGIRSGVNNVGVCQYFSSDGRGRVKKSSIPRSPAKQRRRVSNDEKKIFKSENQGDYDGVPFLDSNESSPQNDTKSKTFVAVLEPSRPDRKFRDRATRPSFADLFSSEEGVHDDEEEDGDYEDKESEYDDRSTNPRYGSEIMSPSVR